MSNAIAATLRPIPIPERQVLRSDPAAQAFMLLRIAFVVAPIAVVDLQEQRVPRDDAEEHAAMIQADAAEHRSRYHVSQVVQLSEDECLERLAHLEGGEPFALAVGGPRLLALLLNRRCHTDRR